MRIGALGDVVSVPTEGLTAVLLDPTLVPAQVEGLGQIRRARTSVPRPFEARQVRSSPPFSELSNPSGPQRRASRSACRSRPCFSSRVLSRPRSTSFLYPLAHTERKARTFGDRRGSDEITSRCGHGDDRVTVYRLDPPDRRWAIGRSSVTVRRDAPPARNSGRREYKVLEQNVEHGFSSRPPRVTKREPRFEERYPVVSVACVPEHDHGTFAAASKYEVLVRHAWREVVKP